jgi:transcriptional regulator with XRE-family HTH domain
MSAAKVAPTSAFPKLLCSALRRLREARGISRRDLAKQLGITTSRLRQFEDGRAFNEGLYERVVQALHRPEATDA